MRLHILLADTLNFLIVNRHFSLADYNKVMGPNNSSHWWNRNLSGTAYNLTDYITAGIHTPTVRNTINSRFPNSQNNGAAWYDRGMNLEFQGGFYIHSPCLTIDFRPHLIYQQNDDFYVLVLHCEEVVDSILDN